MLVQIPRELLVATRFDDGYHFLCVEHLFLLFVVIINLGMTMESELSSGPP